MQRRRFLSTALAATGASMAPLLRAQGHAVDDGAATVPALPRGATVLFQGDSITEGGRWLNSHDPNHMLGQSYPYLLAAQCGGHHPEQGWHFVNRGISGNTVRQLAARWEQDTLALRPRVLSILVGVNDTLGQFDSSIAEPSSVADYASVYGQLLQQTRQALPQVQLVLCEPFTLPGVRNRGRWAAFRQDVAARQHVVRQLAQHHHAVFVPLQAAFEDASRKGPADYWIWDGVHPTYAGHALLADHWLAAVGAARA